MWISMAKRTRLSAIGRRLRAKGVSNDEVYNRMAEAPLIQGGVLLLAPGRAASIVCAFPERAGAKLPVDEIRTAIRALPRPVVWPPEPTDLRT